MLNPGSNIFEKIQNTGQVSHAGLDFVENQSKTNTKFVKSKNVVSGFSDVTLQGSVSTGVHSVATESKVSGKAKRFPKRKTRFVPTCHFCGVKGHIRPRCITMNNMFASEIFPKYRNKHNKNVVQKWVEKVKCFTSTMCFKTDSSHMWYFDSGCSRHMTGNKEFLVNIRPMQGGDVTFGNGLNGKILGIGTLNFEGLPRLKNVMLVDGLRANLLCISQICDQNTMLIIIVCNVMC